jgi:hypothetical protein
MQKLRLRAVHSIQDGSKLAMPAARPWFPRRVRVVFAAKNTLRSRTSRGMESALVQLAGDTLPTRQDLCRRDGGDQARP